VIRPRILLADDHHEILEAEIALLLPHFDVVGVTTDGLSLVSEVQRLNPEVVVVDITMPMMNGIDAVHKLRQSGASAKFVFLTINTGPEFVQACQDAGALGYVWKSRMKTHLIPAIEAALKNITYVSPLASS
jgi:DNA-binding NarL/FixJ family response regulator